MDADRLIAWDDELRQAHARLRAALNATRDPTPPALAGLRSSHGGLSPGRRGGERPMIGTIDEDECFALLETTTVGRVGFVHRGRIEIIPVNYRMHGRDVLMRTRADGVLAELPDEPDVAFEVDHHDDLAGTAWNVLLSGRVEVMPPEEVDELSEAERVLPWAGGERALWLRYVADRVSGRRVRRELG